MTVHRWNSVVDGESYGSARTSSMPGSTRHASVASARSNHAKSGG
jgi:hypothetical protein